MKETKTVLLRRRVDVINILGIPFEIFECAEPDEDMAEDCMGKLKCKEQKILLKNCLRNEFRKHVLFHEIIHGFCGYSHFYEELRDEVLTDCLAHQFAVMFDLDKKGMKPLDEQSIGQRKLMVCGIPWTIVFVDVALVDVAQCKNAENLATADMLHAKIHLESDLNPYVLARELLNAIVHIILDYIGRSDLENKSMFANMLVNGIFPIMRLSDSVWVKNQ